PSSAGKTTFSKRLAWHLEQAGAQTLAISTDDFFVGDARNPRDADGKLDYEHLNAIDLDLLNTCLSDLLAGREAHLPRFDFHTHAPFPERHPARLPAGAFAIIEGLHSLNPALTPAIPASAKHTILADTATNPYGLPAGREGLATPGQRGPGAAEAPATVPHGTPQRLIRRLIRDAKYRGRDAAATIAIWPSVTAGEARWIRPFANLADETFDTSLPSEPSFLRPYAEPALAAIPPSSPSHATAQGLLALLSQFPPLDAAPVPPFSILREYIGGSGIEY
ncbi:MAG: nucleoside kinase, partial [Kiritimatiellae bacterium]|nr:nucleoside kinase [Kiritimatiellia bacterium]